MRMNKRGEVGSDTFFAYAMMVLVAVIVASFYIRYSAPVGSAGDQLPNDRSILAGACQQIAASEVDFLDSAYCMQPREASYGGTFFGLFSKTEIMNCEYAKSKNYFSLTGEAPKCNQQVDQWALNYCGEQKQLLGDSYKEDLIVNGKRCGPALNGVQGWGVAKTGSGNGTVASAGGAVTGA